MIKETIEFAGKTLTVETGRLARQANGAVFITYGETQILVTATGSSQDRPDAAFFPLTVDYVEKFASAGKIPGGFFKREGRQSEREILTSRLTDRPIRPLFPKGYQRETQVIATVFGFDQENEADILSILGASSALTISELPFMGPIAAVRVGRIDGKLVLNPTLSQMESSTLELIVASSKEATVMVEGSAHEATESEVLEALQFAFEETQPLLALQDRLREAAGKPKWTFEPTEHPLLSDVSQTIESKFGQTLVETMQIEGKIVRNQAFRKLKEEIVASFEGSEDAEAKQALVGKVFEQMISDKMRNHVCTTGRRADGRNPDEVRAITVDTSVLPRVHGSAVFTRGETQAMVTATLGTGDDEQRIDSLLGDSKRAFMLHYNFPPFCVGETKPLRGPARREIGHGALAWKALGPVIPSQDDFPYTIRVVSDVLESHGSSSMATVCGGTMSMLDAAVPLKAPVAGIAMGLIKEGDAAHVLSDISGDEDHFGDMDFKVAGTKNGVTAVQMDIKVTGIGWEELEKALEQARQGRMHILSKMNEALDGPRQEPSKYAPRMESIKIKKDKIRELIGPGGKNIRSITEESGAKIDIDDDGTVRVSSVDADSLQKAIDMIQMTVAEPEVGKIYEGKVEKLAEYGAFVEIMPGTTGLLHISEFYTDKRPQHGEEHLSEGDTVKVKLLDVERGGRMKLSEREAHEPGSSNFKPGEGRGGDRERRPRRAGGDGRGRGRGRD